MPENKKLIPMADNSIDAIQARQTAQSEGRKSYVEPDTRGGGDFGLYTSNKLSLNTGINLNPESYGARLGAKYQWNNFSGSVEYDKPLSGKHNLSGSVSYRSEKGYGSADYNSLNKGINLSGGINTKSGSLSGSYGKSESGSSASVSVNRNKYTGTASTENSYGMRSYEGSLSRDSGKTSISLSGGYDNETGPSVRAGVKFRLGR